MQKNDGKPPVKGDDGNGCFRIERSTPEDLLSLLFVALTSDDGFYERAVEDMMR